MTALGLPETMTALSNRAIELAWLGEPVMTFARTSDVGRVLAWSSEIAPEFYLQFLMVSDQFARQDPEAVRRFVTAHLRGQRDYYRAFVTRESSDSEREAIIEYLMQYTPLKDRALYDRMGYVAVEPNGYVDPAVLEQFQDWVFQKGRVPQKVDMRALIDPQYVNYAVERLGKLPDRYR